jgi:uncharacterized protein (DUF2336 family)
MSTLPSGILEDLEQAFAHGTPERRTAALWHATDLLMVGRYSEQQIWVFGEIIDRLAIELEQQTRARLSELLSRSNNAPFQTIAKLAQDDSISVAGPVLKHSTRFAEADLIGVARAKGQDHLLALAQRSTLSKAITDVLVVRGNDSVARTAAQNEGAQFSDQGYWHLVMRSENDSILAECVGSRKDIPRPVFLQLIARASDVVKERLKHLAPNANDQIQHAVSDVTGAVNAKFGPASKQYFAARRMIQRMHRSGDLGEAELYEFARRKQFEEATISLSLICGVLPDVTERALLEKTPEMLLILGKSAELSWQTIEALIIMSAGEIGINKEDLHSARATFWKLSVTTAKRVLAFYETRRRSS